MHDSPLELRIPRRFFKTRMDFGATPLDFYFQFSTELQKWADENLEHSVSIERRTSSDIMMGSDILTLFRYYAVFGSVQDLVIFKLTWADQLP